jgi:hypothetical protein
MADKQLDNVKHTSAPNKKTGATVAKAGANKSKSTTAPYSIKPKGRK